MMIKDYPKVLIVGTLPYSPNESSRALDTYFHGWPNDCLQMIFSNSSVPIKGHCSSLFQIKDIDLFKHRFSKKHKIGTVFNRDKLSTETVKESERISAFEKCGKKKTSLRYLLRRKVWSNDIWYTQELKEWVDAFDPNIIYICFSDDYFVLDIGYRLAQERNIPIVCQISDDYYFLFKNNKNIFLKKYINDYLSLFKKIMDTDGFAIYISDKISNDYNRTFKKQGFPVFLSSEICEKKIHYDSKKIIFNYLGKINLGRYRSLGLLNDALQCVDKNYKINVYTSDKTKKYLRYLKKHKCVLKPPVNYENVKKIMTQDSVNIIASGFDNYDVQKSKYSLSTKVADCLASKNPIIAIGSSEDGAISYLKENDCGYIIDNSKIDIEGLKEFLKNDTLVIEKIKKADKLYLKNHSFENNNNRFQEKCISLKRVK